MKYLPRKIMLNSTTVKIAALMFWSNTVAALEGFTNRSIDQPGSVLNHITLTLTLYKKTLKNEKLKEIILLHKKKELGMGLELITTNVKWNGLAI